MRHVVAAMVASRLASPEEVAGRATTPQRAPMRRGRDAVRGRLARRAVSLSALWKTTHAGS